MTIKEAYDWIDTDCIAALVAGTTAEDWASMNEDERYAVAKEYADYFNLISSNDQ